MTRRRTIARRGSMFGYSIFYLFALFALLIVDGPHDGWDPSKTE